MQESTTSPRMRILQVIHGYPMRFNAGSEVYTQSLCHALAVRNDVRVFTRAEDPLLPDDTMATERDPDDARIQLNLVNIPGSRDRYRRVGVDARFGEVLDEFRPDVIHVGHLNHLSTSVVDVADGRGIPIVFTLHDFWLMCPRGQFLQQIGDAPSSSWTVCSGQDDRKCAESCYAKYFSGAPDDDRDANYWSDWVRRRMAHVRDIAGKVDLFVAPSKFLLARFRSDFGLPATKSVYLDYGFDYARLSGRSRTPESDFVFGYIGTHTQAKGIHQLLEAFGRVPGTPRLRIFGRPRSELSEALRSIGRGLPNGADERVEWLPEYKNADIVREVFNRVDAVVVPSIWEENSPLVIHEAQQARVPVITADVGGMAEYVHHGLNGLLFRHRDVLSLAAAMEELAVNPRRAEALGRRGYIDSPSGDVVSLSEHAAQVEYLYARVIRERRIRRMPTRRGPWRVTFDTNPDDCNLHCVMCEEHSPHSDRQRQRHAQGKTPRRMPLELAARVLEDLKDTPLREVIPSTMGEPLLYRDFDALIALCMRHGVLMNLTTNGTFPRLGAEAWARKLVPILSDVKVSWNGATESTHRAVMGSSFEVSLQNLRTFLRVRDEHAERFGHRARVTLQLTFLETNVAELPAIVELAAREGVDRVKGHHLWAHFDEVRALSLRRSPESVARWNAAVRAAREVAATSRLPNGAHVLLEHFHELKEGAAEDLAPGGRCPFLGEEAWVSAEGRFDPCCAPDAERRTLGDFGNLHTVSIAEVWSGAPYQALRESYLERALCRGCTMRRPE